MEDIKYKNYKIRAVESQDVESPRGYFDYETEMVCFHNRYVIGDKSHGYTPESLQELIEGDIVFALPLYLYDHSGLSISTEPFGCRFDSGKIGYIIYNKDKWYSTNRNLEDNAVYALMREEVETYNQYLTNEIYDLEVIDNEGTTVECVSNFYGQPEDSGLIEEGKAIVDALTARAFKIHIGVLKTLIKNKVPLIMRSNILAKFN